MKIITVGDICDVIKGKSLYTKSYGSAHKGEYPVFSASNNAPLTFIDSHDFDGKYITWATNGFAGYIKIIDGKFSINADRGLLVPKIENIDIDYIKIILEPILRGLAKGRKGDNAENEFTKVYPWMVEQVEIQIPTDEDGNFDLAAQQEIASSYILLDEYKKQLQTYQQRIKQLQVMVEEIGESREVKIYKIFDVLPVSKKIKKEDLQGEGLIPTYSSQCENEGLMGNYTEAMFECSLSSPLITFGDHTKAIYIRTTPFSVVDNVKVLQLKKEHIGVIDINFILGFRKPLLPSLGYARHWKDSKNCIISIPTLPDGTFDLVRQQEIAHIYETIAQIKQQISEKLQTLQDIQVIL